MLWTNWPKGDPQANYQIFRIDMAINAVRQELERREHITRIDAALYQRAWDRNPDLKAREDALFRLRNKHAQRRDRIAEREFKAAERAEAARARARFAAFCDSRDELLRHVERYEQQTGLAA